MVSTDVFDTLLFRTRRSERSRVALAERRFAALLARAGLSVSADVLVEVRLRVQAWSYRALNVGSVGEVRLRDIVSRQLHILGLPQTWLAPRLELELEVERESLVPNRELASLLRQRRQSGARVVAVSDTALSGAQVEALLVHFHGPGLVDAVYSSADYGQTKRDGALFATVARAEKVALHELVHMGDDASADVLVPAQLGVRTVHLPRPKPLGYLRRLDGATTEAGRWVRRRSERLSRRSERRTASNPELFGSIVTQFCMLLWSYAAQAEQTHQPVLLFCARGGVGIREAFERTLLKLALPLRAPRRNLWVSRLVAARAALLAGDPAALQEIGRELAGASFAAVAKALGGRAYALDAAWQRTFASAEFLPLLHSPSGADVLADLTRQHALFAQHLREQVGDCDRIILCDTGLYGSTQRLLAAGFPELRFETVQFARSNYKRFSEEHFPRVAGLLVESSYYTPWRPATCVLRYWHLIESLFEPSVPSVRSFALDAEGNVVANSGLLEYGLVDASRYSDLLSAALGYIEQLSERDGEAAWTAAERAWRQLHEHIVHPTEGDLQRLRVGSRSVDFGRDHSFEAVAPVTQGGFASRLRSIKTQPWREAAIVRAFPTLKHVLLPALSAAHVTNWLLRQNTRQSRP